MWINLMDFDKQYEVINIEMGKVVENVINSMVIDDLKLLNELRNSLGNH